AHYQLMQYVRKEHPRNRVFIVHRLDQATSGVMVFAKNEYAKKALQKNWQKQVQHRGYVALVEGKFTKEAEYYFMVKRNEDISNVFKFYGRRWTICENEVQINSSE